MDPITLTVVAAAVAVGAVGGSATLMGMEAKAANEEAKQAADAEREAALSRTDARLAQVRQYRSSQRVASAAAGLSPSSGSVASIGEDLDEQARADQYADTRASEYRAKGMRTRGTNARRAGYIGAGISLLDGAFDAGSAFARMPRGKA